MALCEGDGFRRVALHDRAASAWPTKGNVSSLIPRAAAPTLDRAVRTKHVVHVSDIAADKP